MKKPPAVKREVLEFSFFFGEFTFLFLEANLNSALDVNPLTAATAKTTLVACTPTVTITRCVGYDCAA